MASAETKRFLFFKKVKLTAVVTSLLLLSISCKDVHEDAIKLL